MGSSFARVSIKVMDGAVMSSSLASDEIRLKVEHRTCFLARSAAGEAPAWLAS
eukprot:SAG31_NODE_3235_length_4512_cov_2.549513_4_plen_53_part_00